MNWILTGCVLVIVSVLYGVICLIKALCMPTDAWTEVHRTVGFRTGKNE